MMWYQTYPKFLKMTSLLHSGTLFGLDTSPRFIRLPPKKYDRPSTTELELSFQLLLVASSRIGALQALYTWKNTINDLAMLGGIGATITTFQFLR